MLCCVLFSFDEDFGGESFLVFRFRDCMSSCKGVRYRVIKIIILEGVDTGRVGHKFILMNPVKLLLPR